MTTILKMNGAFLRACSIICLPVKVKVLKFAVDQWNRQENNHFSQHQKTALKLKLVILQSLSCGSFDIRLAYTVIPHPFILPPPQQQCCPNSVGNQYLHCYNELLCQKPIHDCSFASYSVSHIWTCLDDGNCHLATMDLRMYGRMHHCLVRGPWQ